MQPPKSDPDLPLVTVVAAFHVPAPALVRRQIASIVGQTGVRLNLVGVLDGAETASDAGLTGSLRQEGFDIIVNDEARGVRAAFEAGLRHAISRAAGPGYFAYSDQDDVWHLDKLAKSVAELRTNAAQMVYCDARVVDAEGHVIATSLHDYEARQEPADLLQHLLLNAVSGMTAVFTEPAARLAAAMMRGNQTVLLHDHITAVAAASLGAVVRLPEPLVDYVQHESNQLGAMPRAPAWRRRGLGVGHLSAYRTTSAAIFNERRLVAAALAREGQLPRPLSTMFLIHRPSFASFEATYLAAIAALLKQGQRRRAMLCLRLMDAAFSAWIRQRQQAIA